MTQSDIRALAEAAFVVLSFFVMAPAVAAVIGYRASKGIPKSFNGAMYWTSFVAIGAVAATVIRYAVRMEARDDPWWNFLRFTILGLGATPPEGISLGNIPYVDSDHVVATGPGYNETAETENDG